MHHVVTLLAPERSPCPVEEAVSLLRESGLSILSARWVEKSVAYDIVIGDSPNETIHEQLQHEATDHWRVDVMVQPLEARKKKLLISDMDSTIIAQECIDELGDLVGKKAEISEITERAMRGELDFEAALRARVAMLKGLKETELQRTLETRITLSKGAKILVKTMAAHGAHTALVSGGFTFFTRAIAAQAGFHTHAGNVLGIKDGMLTGTVESPVLDKHSKLAMLQKLCEEKDIAPQYSMALGDGANDLPMLLAAGLGVAYRAKPAVCEAARAQLNYCDLSYLLYAQGIEKAQWVSD